MSASPFYVTVRELLTELREIVALPEPVRAPLLNQRVCDLLLAIRVLEGAERRSVVAGLQTALAPIRPPKTRDASARDGAEIARPA